MERTQSVLWRARLGSAFRTSLACTIVGCTTLYGPSHLRSDLAFPAFAYLVTMLIVFDATLGDTLHGLWNASLATVQVLPFAIISLWFIGPGNFTPLIAAGAVAVGVLLVALPESTQIMCKRIAFGQIVVVFVGVVIHGAETDIVLHPVHVASCTALGAFASVTALLLPYPRLAYFEVRKACREYTDNTSERLSVLNKAFSAQDSPTAFDLISEAKFLAESGATTPIKNINLIQEGMFWETPHVRFLKRNGVQLRERLESMETPLRGMELALTSCPSFPVTMANSGIRDTLQTMEQEIRLKLEQAKCSLPFEYSTTAPENKVEVPDNSMQILTDISQRPEDLSPFFFLFCMKLLQNDSGIPPESASTPEKCHKAESEEAIDSNNQSKFYRTIIMISNFTKILLKRERLIFASKCSLSLGLAVLCGLIYNKENGYWSGLTIAISFVTGRQATFTVANARAQGTVMGSVYGILGCFIIQKYAEARFALLFPWIIFTTFLKHSQMYGQSGGFSAVIGAILILGRKDYGPESVFAIARITEVIIGLSCFITVEFLFQPTRAATLAKEKLAQCLKTLGECIEEIALDVKESGSPTHTFRSLRIRQKRLKTQVKELEKLIEEARLEPNLWFLPFRESFYNEILRSLLNMADILLFVAYETEFLSQVSMTTGVAWKDLQECVEDNLELFRTRVGTSLKCLEEVTLLNSLTELEKELQKNKHSRDIELGKVAEEDRIKLLSTDEEEVKHIQSSFLQHLKDANNKKDAGEGREGQKSQMVLYLSSLGFCISSLMKGTIEIEKQVKELVKWENHLSRIDLKEIYYKINTLCIYKYKSTSITVVSSIS